MANYQTKKSVIEELKDESAETIMFSVINDNNVGYHYVSNVNRRKLIKWLEKNQTDFDTKKSVIEELKDESAETIILSVINDNNIGYHNVTTIKRKKLIKWLENNQNDSEEE